MIADETPKLLDQKQKKNLQIPNSLKKPQNINFSKPTFSTSTTKQMKQSKSQIMLGTSSSGTT